MSLAEWVASSSLTQVLFQRLESLGVFCSILSVPGSVLFWIDTLNVFLLVSVGTTSLVCGLRLGLFWWPKALQLPSPFKLFLVLPWIGLGIENQEIWLYKVCVTSCYITLYRFFFINSILWLFLKVQMCLHAHKISILFLCTNACFVTDIFFMGQFAPDFQKHSYFQI